MVSLTYTTLTKSFLSGSWEDTALYIMRVENLRPGLILARPVFSADGGLLLNRGVVLRESYIRHLAKLGYYAVYVGEPDEPLPEDVISVETQAKATRAVASAFESARIGGTIDVGSVQSAANSIVDEVIRNREVALALTDIHSYDNYTFSHSLNVCVLSVIMGLSMGINTMEVKELAVGALLHDIGKVLIPDKIIKKPGDLNADEWEEMKLHPQHGFHLLRCNHQISARAAHVAYQHHERWNGQGYPRGLVGEQIHLFGRIAAVADSYDAMTSDRVYRRGKQPFDALRVIRSLRNLHYDPEAADALLSNIVPYPVGCTVQLNSGEIGVVVDIHRRDKDRPVIRLQYDSKGRRIKDTVEIDLQWEKSREIRRIVVG